MQILARQSVERFIKTLELKSATACVSKYSYLYNVVNITRAVIGRYR